MRFSNYVTSSLIENYVRASNIILIYMHYCIFTNIKHLEVSLTDSGSKCDQLINTNNCQLTCNNKLVNGNANIN